MKVDEIVAKAQAAVRSSKQRVKKSKIVKASSLKMIEETRLRKRNRLRNQAAPTSPKGDYCITFYLVYTCRHWNEGKTPLSLELSSNE
jgi:hypothetical protein